METGTDNTQTEHELLVDGPWSRN